MTTENSAETCRNPFCVVRKCRFRHDADSGNLDDEDSEKIGCGFVMSEDGIGILKVLGSIDETSDEATNALLHHVDRLKGLLVVACSSGGSGTHIDLMRDAVLLTSAKNIPTVAWIDRACSGAFEIAISCQTVFCNPEGEAGGLGLAVFRCHQGVLPALVVSSQTPKKDPSISRGPSSICQLTFNPKTLNKLQAGLDDDAEEIFRFITKQRSLPFLSVLEGIGDGHAAKADELLKKGLIDKICSIDEAKVELIIKIWFGDKQTINEGEENESFKSTFQEN